MNKIKTCKPVRGLIALLTVLLLTGGCVLLVLTGYLGDRRFYSDRPAEIYSRIACDYMAEFAGTIRDVYVDNPQYTFLENDKEKAGKWIEELVGREDMTFEVSDFGEIIHGNVPKEEPLSTKSFSFSSELLWLSDLSEQLQAGMLPELTWEQNGVFPRELAGVVNPEEYETNEDLAWAKTSIPHLFICLPEKQLYWLTGEMQIRISLAKSSRNHTALGMKLQAAELMYQYRYSIPVAGGIMMALGLLLLILYIATAGYVREDENVVLRGDRLEKMPLDIMALLWLILLALLLSPVVLDLFDLFYMIYDLTAFLLSMGLALLFVKTVVVRCRLGLILKGWWITSVWKFLQKYLETGWSYAKKGLSRMPYYWQAALLLAILTVIEIFTLGGPREYFLLVWLLEKILLVPIICYCVYAFKKLLEGAKKIAGGQSDVRVNEPGMLWVFREFADTLDHLEDGLGQAVEARMKSERLRTELITNVSHDIKTPLTGIVSYVDLLKKTDLPEGPAREYVEVLDRQSGKLKKLIEDLVEASKAATGNLTVNPEICDLQVLLEQIMAEYQEKMDEKSLSPVVKFPEESVKVLADGRHMWRIFDNLLTNICKYTLPGTRVYVNVEQTEKEAKITFRNISATPLNMAADELMERFTRGDSSRHTEGSGLGLSIASSLTALQKGYMELSVDGDLFKVVLNFPKIQMP